MNGQVVHQVRMACVLGVALRTVDQPEKTVALRYMLHTWLLQHYALVVWLTTGPDTKKRKPAPLSRLARLINTTITGQALFLFLSGYFLVGGRAWPDSFLVSSIVLVVAGLLVWVLPGLQTRTQQGGIPALFRQLSIGQRRTQAWAGFLLFWASFASIFFVAASFN